MNRMIFSLLAALSFALPGLCSAEFFSLRHRRPDPADERKLMGDTTPRFTSDESAARAYLKAVFKRNLPKNATLMGPIGEGGPAVSLVRTIESPATKTRVLRFEQTHNELPVFGSLAAIELDEERRLVSLTARLGSPGGVPSEPKLTADDAIEALLRQTRQLEKEPGRAHPRPVPAKAPVLCYFRDEGKTWRLTWRIDGLPAAPMGYDPAKEAGHGLKAPFRAARARFNYLVDASDGRVLLAYSASPLAKPEPIIPPTKSKGRDDFGVEREFHVRNAGDGFVLDDTLRRIQTYDLGFRVPLTVRGQLVSDPAAAWDQRYAAAVSAHANATKIFDFYNDLLKRKGIVDDRSYLVSFVNCTSPYQAAPEWHNAEWTGEHMLYGQARDSSGTLRSLARYADIVGHELTHGVVQNTADLVYLGMSGALNESVADIMGVLAKNWDPARPAQDAAAFNWEVGTDIGTLFGRKGPLRDLSDPRRTGLPDHMRDYRKLPPDETGDWGGVHVNSGIHNKAAHNLITARDAAGDYLIPWKEAALLYYLALTRLAPRSGFSEMREALEDVASDVYRLESTRDQKLQAIAKAYDGVGIPLPPP